MYLLFIDPAAAMQIELANNQNRAPDRTIAIILKDFEQETCIMLAIWALSIMWIKWSRVKEQTNLLIIDVLGTDSDLTIPFDNIEKGSIIEYYYVTKRRPKFQGAMVDIESDYDKQTVEFDLYAPSNLSFSFKSFNLEATVKKNESFKAWMEVGY